MNMDSEVKIHLDSMLSPDIVDFWGRNHIQRWGHFLLTQPDIRDISRGWRIAEELMMLAHEVLSED